MPRLSEVERGRCIALVMQCTLQNQVANQFGVRPSTIFRLLQRLHATGRVADRPQSGRPRVTTRRQDKAMRLSHLRNRQ